MARQLDILSTLSFLGTIIANIILLVEVLGKPE